MPAQILVVSGDFVLLIVGLAIGISATEALLDIIQAWRERRRTRV